jgi:hypothetical protein
MQRILFVFALATTSHAVDSSSQTTWYVQAYSSEPRDGRSPSTAFNKIQNGIDSAHDGDTVIVGRGTYFENIHFKGKNITLTGSNPLDPEAVAYTVIDGGGGDSVVTFDGTETRSCVLSGFTVRNGVADYGGGICGGTRDRHTYATIRDNVINGNSAVSAGGNLYHGGGLAYCDGLIEGNTITGNRADYGGGLGGCNGLIRNNTITGNAAARGGGLVHCNGTIRKNLVANNSSTVSGGGLCGCEAIIEANRILGNSAPAGGGLFGCNNVIRSNLIAGNSGSHGGGVSRCNGIIQNNTIAGNSTRDDGGGLSECTAVISNCIVWGNTAPNGAQLWHSSTPAYSCVENWAGGGSGNIREDPRFRDGSYGLAGDSPCIDAGENGEWMWRAVDAGGSPRILPQASSWNVDIGAYEYVSSNLKPLMIARISEDEVWLIRINKVEETCVFWSTHDIGNEAWQEEGDAISSGPLTIVKDLDFADKQKFFTLEIQ